MPRMTYRANLLPQSTKRSISRLFHSSKPTPNLVSDSVNTNNNLDSPIIFPITRFRKTKKLVQISSIALLSLPAQSLTTMHMDINTQIPAYDKVMLQRTLTIAAVPGDSTYFATDGFQHGFGYDLVRGYADELEVSIDLKAYASDEAALRALQSGAVDMALTTASTQLRNELALPSINISCGYDSSLTNNGLNPKVSWAFRQSNDPLSQKASYFLCDSVKLDSTQNLAAFYNQKLLKDNYSQQHFQQTLIEKLPVYQTSFINQAKNYDHDWELLVAMGYQESHLNADAVSPTGVRGLMMLTNSTAKAMGVADRVDPMQSIGGGARYLEQMKSDFADVPKTDRIWFALAAYNMGPNAIKGIQQQLTANGIDDKNWANIYAYLAKNQASNSRYGQAMQYVSNIRSYLEIMKLQPA
ncbi:transglycosylase SLT domain-containing protein [Psychrobacter sp. GP33]|uniref:transglycosylase SLT domain-containing protein n=1 Tax=Psychrobacter sp. GP33 TaxID=2758709 RepID=UPI0021751AAD|nr:transglycosylase SLT domain-containing protein [Psychrobacter sp. GP33]